MIPVPSNTRVWLAAGVTDNSPDIIPSEPAELRAFVLTRIADHKINRIDELLPWNYKG